MVTGSAGAVGRAVCGALRERGHFVRGLDLRQTSGVDESVVGGVADPAAVDAAMTGMDTLIHLAATTDDADFVRELLPNNILGLYYVLEAARKHGLRRVILASSIQTVSGHWRHRKPGESRLIRVEDGTAPRNQYAVTKILAEEMGKMYALKWNMSVLVVRIGWLHRNVESALHQRTHGGDGAYLSQCDAGRFFLRAVEVESLKYGVVFAVSRNKTEEYDLTGARQMLGYEPQDRFPEGLGFLLPEANSATA